MISPSFLMLSLCLGRLHFWGCPYNDSRVTNSYILCKGRTKLFHIDLTTIFSDSLRLEIFIGKLKVLYQKEIILLHYLILARRSHNLCLQVLNNSDRSLRLADSGWKIIMAFSFVHKLHYLVTGLKGFALPIIFRFTAKFLPSSCRCHTEVESVVVLCL